MEGAAFGQLFFLQGRLTQKQKECLLISALFLSLDAFFRFFRKTIENINILFLLCNAKCFLSGEAEHKMHGQRS